MDRRTFVAAVTGAAIAGGPRLGAQPAPAAGKPPALVLADMIESDYLFPEAGARYAAALRRAQAAGAYRALAGEPLAERLTADLQAVAADGHLRVQTVESLPPRPGAPAAGRRRTPTLQDAGLLGGRVAYLRYTSFLDDAEATAATAAFMREQAGARALIVDCRYNGGGGLAQMNAILPYLYARETELVTMEMREALAAQRGSPFDDEPTVRLAAPGDGLRRQVHFVTPRTDETRWRDAAVFYLVSPGTASAAEHLALAFRRTKRATLIGAPTAGANHFGGFVPLTDDLAVFMPVGRTFDPDTGKDWEKTGIAPDVAVPPATALAEALRRAGQ